MTRRTAQTLRDRTPLLALLVLLAGAAATPAAAEDAAASGRYYLPVVVACRPEPGDQILDFICRRIQADAPELAHARGMTLAVEGPVHPQDRWQAPRDTVALEVALTGTRPASQFGQKEITARLSGPSLDGDDGWSTGIAATGVPRDLVHPVADAVLANIDAYLARRAEWAAHQR